MLYLLVQTNMSHKQTLEYVMDLQNFTRALRDLGKNDKERAQLLGLTTKSVERYRAGKLPKAVRGLLSNPTLLEALEKDASNNQPAQN